MSNSTMSDPNRLAGPSGAPRARSRIARTTVALVLAFAVGCQRAVVLRSPIEPWAGVAPAQGQSVAATPGFGTLVVVPDTACAPRSRRPEAPCLPDRVHFREGIVIICAPRDRRAPIRQVALRLGQVSVLDSLAPGEYDVLVRALGFAEGRAKWWAHAGRVDTVLIRPVPLLLDLRNVRVAE